eukprot:TRINITY_DN47730_c0_g1_i1.p1 TRINITY_DN47730_c0_g1~~TRINITY_DN47730_c0_g1_i1.p1  ORF type:complete len:363 (+),score=102.44 TRINITY_DN47730_c0_g1_i1:59-1090(+)
MPLYAMHAPSGTARQVSPEEVLVPRGGEAIPSAAAAATQTTLSGPGAAAADLLTPGHTPTAGTAGAAAGDAAAVDAMSRINPLIRRLRQGEAAELLAGLESLRAAGLGGGETLQDAVAALRHALPVVDPAAGGQPGQPRQPEAVDDSCDFNRVLEEAISEHYRGWLEQAQRRARRAVAWVLSSMLDDAARGRSELVYDIPPGADEPLHDSLPEWMGDERGAEALRGIVAHELAERGLRIAPEALEERRSGEGDERISFRLTYTVPHPADVPPERLAPSPAPAPLRRQWEARHNASSADSARILTAEGLAALNEGSTREAPPTGRGSGAHYRPMSATSATTHNP